MDLVIQIISNDKTVRSDKKLDLKEFNNQSLIAQAKKGEQLVNIMHAIKWGISLLGIDIIGIPTGNDALKNKKGSYDQQWLEETKAKLLKQINDDKRVNLIMSRVKKQMERHSINVLRIL